MKLETMKYYKVPNQHHSMVLCAFTESKVKGTRENINLIFEGGSERWQRPD